ncbi:MAG: hypothetical protein ABWZ15_18280 [Acidimicrobiia bacterium]
MLIAPQNDVPTVRRRWTLLAAARASFGREPGLTAVGIAGMLLSAVCLIAVAVRGRTIPPEGKMLDAATFAFGIGVYTLSIALLLPLAGYSRSARMRWRRLFYVFVVYGYVVETTQAFRGLDPRFSDEGEQIDAITGAVFGVTALLNTVLFVVLGLRFFRSTVLEDRPVLRLGIRYGVVAVMLSFAVGSIMSVLNGREVGDEGNLLIAHALGVHGIQVLPVVALAVGACRAGTRPPTWVHVAGVAWLVACVAALLQALMGDPPFEPSALTALIVAALAVFSAIAAMGVSSYAFARADEPRSTVQVPPVR